MEEMQTPEEKAMTLQTQISCLMSELSSPVSAIGDWKIAKCQEYALAGIEAPYDIAELHAQRQAVRDRINELKAELAALEPAG